MLGPGMHAAEGSAGVEGRCCAAGEKGDIGMFLEGRVRLTARPASFVRGAQVGGATGGATGGGAGGVAARTAVGPAPLLVRRACGSIHDSSLISEAKSREGKSGSISDALASSIS